MVQRKKIRHTVSFSNRLKAFQEKEQRKADSLPAGPEKEQAQKKVREAQTALKIDGWAQGLEQPEE